MGGTCHGREDTDFLGKNWFFLVAQHFGGDVHLVSMEGNETDVFIRLDHIGNVLEFSDYDGFDLWRSLKNQPTDDDYKVFFIFYFQTITVSTFGGPF